jgi:ATP-dependent helicase HepA
MTVNSFVPGQRWVSATEAELGLGVVDHLDGRLVVLQFPATGATRTYAANNAPLGRVRYAVGDSIRNTEGCNAEVIACEERGGLLFYLGKDEFGEEVVVPEFELDGAVRFSKPQDRLFAGQIDRNKLFGLRADTLNHRHRHRTSPVLGLLGPRVQLLPHQLYIANQVGTRHAPRVLLADEVGLGKTIEAGLIIHQQLVTGRATRVLIALPDSLVHQWLVEMRRRFDLRFTIIDEDRCLALTGIDEGIDIGDEDDESEEREPVPVVDNPFETAQLVITPLSLLSDDPQRAEQALEAGWDLLVVDEAHHLTFNDGAASPAYDAVDTIARDTPSVLLLTATPEQLGAHGHFARLRLLDPHRYSDIDAFHEEEAGYRALRELVDEVLEADEAAAKNETLSEALLKRIAEYLGSDELELLTGPDGVDAAAIVNALLDRHGTGRTLFRNMRSTVGGFPRRELLAHPLMDTWTEIDPLASMAERLCPEILEGEGWVNGDPRVEWLVDFLGARPRDKVLVTCALDSTALDLELHLRLRHGVRSAAFHRGADLVARDRAAAYFADMEEGAQVLVCSEIGSEGRNFQFAQDLVLFDLPRSAEVLEQRIGRIDRIGQTDTVRIHVPYVEEGTTHRLFRWYDEGLNAFEEPCAIGERMQSEYGEAVEEAVTLFEDVGELDAVIDATRARATQLRDELQAGRDRLVELNSCRPDAAHTVIGEIFDAQRSRELADYLDRLLDHFGVDQERGDGETVVLHPGTHMLQESMPGLPDDGMTGTFDRNMALVREDLSFLTWEHPLVDGAMDTLIRSGAGNTALGTVKIKALQAGSLLLEARFAVHCPAPQALQIQRFLPTASLRIVCDEQSRNLSDALGEAALAKLVYGVPAATSLELVKHARDRISALVTCAQKLVTAHSAPMIKEAKALVSDMYGPELARLNALARANGTVRAEEITRLEGEMEQADALVSDLQLSLDAIRVLVVTAPDGR